MRKGGLLFCPVGREIQRGKYDGRILQIECVPMGNFRKLVYSEHYELEFERRLAGEISAGRT